MLSKEILDWIISLGEILLCIFTAAWAVNRLWLTSIYVTKKDFMEWMKTEYKVFLTSADGMENKIKEEIAMMKHKFEMFELQYKSDTALHNEKDKTHALQQASDQKHIIDNLHKLANDVNKITAVNPETLIRMGEEIEKFKEDVTNEVKLLKSKSR